MARELLKISLNNMAYFFALNDDLYLNAFLQYIYIFFHLSFVSFRENFTLRTGINSHLAVRSFMSYMLNENLLAINFLKRKYNP